VASKINITVTQSILINKPVQEVFDFTQDFSKRMLWDKSIIDCRLISETPFRTAFIKVKGGMTANLEYKLFERPCKTSLRMTNISFSLIVDGGGSWLYQKQADGATLWTQTNTLSLKNNLITKILMPYIERSLKRNTFESMKSLKKIME
jgi:hypothetical protein